MPDNKPFVPPVPGVEAPPTHGASFRASDGFAPQSAYAAAPPQVVVQLPPQKKSKAPWIALIIIAVLFFGCIGVSALSCSSIVSSAGELSATAPITSGDTVAVIHMSGTIEASGSGAITPENTLEELSNAQDDPHVKAIVLRIDSGGGSAAASEEIASYVRDCEKPVVVSAADSCASGAYMAASQADYIYALDGTTVGSIGVIMNVTDLEGLLDKLGISVDSITSGDDKGAGNGYSALTEEQRAYFQQMVNELNGQFIDTVASGRDMTHDEVAALATGKVFTGAAAVENGLIDEVGTFEDACNKAAELGGCPSSYKIVDFDISTGGDLLGLMG